MALIKCHECSTEVSAMRAIIITTLLLTSGWASAFEIEQPVAPVYMHNGATIFRIQDATYTVTPIPNIADLFETFETPPAAYAEGTNGLTLGARITQEEAAKVLEAYYRENAFDFTSIKIRKLQLGALQYAAWCSKHVIFFCQERQFRTGNWVEFEVNGSNRHSGMVGFQRQIFMIRKL